MNVDLEVQRTSYHSDEVPPIRIGPVGSAELVDEAEETLTPAIPSTTSFHAALNLYVSGWGQRFARLDDQWNLPTNLAYKNVIDWLNGVAGPLHRSHATPSQS